MMRMCVRVCVACESVRKAQRASQKLPECLYRPEALWGFLGCELELGPESPREPQRALEWVLAPWEDTLGIKAREPQRALITPRCWYATRLEGTVMDVYAVRQMEVML